MSNTVSYSDFRENLKGYIDTVCNSHDPLLVKRRNGKNVIIIEEDDFLSLEETSYLLRSPANAKKLLEAIATPEDKRIAFNSMEALNHALGI